MANRRDFKTPVAAFEDREVPSTVTVKWCGQFHVTHIPHSPLDVVAWHGNYCPVKYDLRTYCPVGAILFVLITMLGPVSGAQFNPAVSLVMRLRGDCCWKGLAATIAVQVAAVVQLAGEPGYLVAGRQDLVPGRQLVYGQSVTDACLGWKDSLDVLEMLAGAVKERRRHGKGRH